MIAEKFDTFLLDLDGVVYVGDSLLPGALDSLKRLRGRGKAVRFLTNDPRPERGEVASRLNSLGIDACPGEIITCGWACAQYLRKKKKMSAYVLGTGGLCREIEAAGITVTEDESAEAVVVGFDENITYSRIRHAVGLIRKGSDFIATNRDLTFPTPEGPAPAAGAFVAAVQASSGKRPVVIGKPFPGMFRAALKGLDPSKAVMIGDSPLTDIAGARRAGIASVLVSPAAGADKGGDTGSYGRNRPDFVIPSLSGLFDRKLCQGEMEG